MRPVGSYTFVASGDGTRVTFALDADLTGLKKLVMGDPVQKSMDAAMAALDTAKALLQQ